MTGKMNMYGGQHHFHRGFHGLGFNPLFSLPAELLCLRYQYAFHRDAQLFRLYERAGQNLQLLHIVSLPHLPEDMAP